ncbi:hypothetical protein [Arthrobacter sp. 24S4-2]|uniref:hypothetical protein n=1 Tax=Arthrobacter sp. 24S4-2 TaxID=2575374 RepID=UPI001586581C|nr:hypothetical protein [Arthrobacter sp. 24S4-2]
MHKNRFVRLVVSGILLSLAALFGIAAPSEAAGRAGITLSAAVGPAGASVTVTGAGFARQSSGTLTDGSTSVPFTTKGNGSFTAAVTIPPTTFVWFHHNKEVDWRINSSTASTNALAAALATRNS